MNVLCLGLPASQRVCGEQSSSLRHPRKMQSANPLFRPAHAYRYQYPKSEGGLWNKTYLVNS